ncbi:MAG: type II toxin-antitoxin system HicA family toxin [Nanoarchaeota archaeon]|nr:type II toxin-antitoxin system HicA family toxin [Nanoarchaeota archaeon]
MNRRNLKAREFLKALKKYGCIEVRSTDHGVIVENPKNKRSTNVPMHRSEIAVWIYHNIIRQLEIDKDEFEKLF